MALELSTESYTLAPWANPLQQARMREFNKRYRHKIHPNLKVIARCAREAGYTVESALVGSWRSMTNIEKMRSGKQLKINDVITTIRTLTGHSQVNPNYEGTYSHTIIRYKAVTDDGVNIFHQIIPTLPDRKFIVPNSDIRVAYFGEQQEGMGSIYVPTELDNPRAKRPSKLDWSRYLDRWDLFEKIRLANLAS